MQDLKVALEVLENIRKRVEKLSGDEIEEVMPQEREEAIEALCRIGNEISSIFSKLSPLREKVTSARIKLEGQPKEKDPP